MTITPARPFDPLSGGGAMRAAQISSKAALITPKISKAALKPQWPISIAATGAAVAALVLLAVSLFMWGAAKEQTQIAYVRRLAAQSVAIEETLPQRSLLLAVEAVRGNHGNKTLAARSLNISRAYLHRLIRVAEHDPLNEGESFDLETA